MQPHKDIAQAKDKTGIDGTEQGISTVGARGVRIIARAPKGMTFSSGFTVLLATRHGRLGVVLHHIGMSTPSTQPGEIASNAASVLVEVPYSNMRNAVLVGTFPVAHEYGDELIAVVVGASTSGDASDESEAGKVFVTMERVGES
jgi:hypothetical protein